MSTLKKFVFAIVAILLSMLFFWSAADIVASLNGGKPSLTSLETEYVEGRGLMLRRGFQSSMSFVSKEGLRRNGSLPPLVSGEKRILFVGESTCFSYYVMQGQDWPTIVGKELRASGVPVTAMNGGVPGYQMRDAEFAYKWFKPQWPVDIVIIYTMWGDFLPDHSSLPDFNFDLTTKDFYKNWPSSLELNPTYEKYDIPKAKHLIGNTLLKPLQPLIRTSPLAHKLYFLLAGNNTLKNLDWLVNPGAEKSIEYDEVMHSAGRKYMFHLGNLIQQAKQDGTQVVIVKPFSVFRMKNYDGSNKDELLRQSVGKYPKANRHSIMQNWIAQADAIIDEFAKIKNVVVIDPTEGMLEKITSKNAYSNDSLVKKDYSKSYMAGSPHHTGVKGDRLLGKIIAEELIKTGLVQPTKQAPWVHPFEGSKETPKFLIRYSEFPLRVQASILSGNKLSNLGSSFILMMICSLIGAMLLLAVLGINKFENTYGWSVTLGMGVMMSLLISLNQIFNNPALCLVISVTLVIFVLIVILFRNGMVYTPHLKEILAKIFLCGFIGFVLLFGAKQINIEKFNSSNTSTIKAVSLVSSKYLAWMDFQANYSLFEDGTVTFPDLNKKVKKSPLYAQGFYRGFIDLYGTLIRWPDYHDHTAPTLASAIYMISGEDPEGIFLSMLGVPAAVLATPILIFFFLKGVSIIKRIIILAIFVFSFYVGIKILIPIAQYGIIGVITMILAIYLPGDKFYRGIIFCIGAAISILVPDPMMLVLLFGLTLVYGIKNSFTSRTHNKKIGASIASAVVLVIFGKCLMLNYPAVHTPIYEFLNQKELILFGPWTQTDIVLLLLVFCCFGYFLVRQSSSVLIALLSLVSIFISFHYSQVVFRVIPISAVIVMVFLEFTRVSNHYQSPKFFVRTHESES